jgi:hypothetical protein
MRGGLGALAGVCKLGATSPWAAGGENGAFGSVTLECETAWHRPEPIFTDSATKRTLPREQNKIHMKQNQKNRKGNVEHFAEMRDPGSWGRKGTGRKQRAF